MKLTVERLDGTTYDTDTLGLTVLDFVVSSPNLKHHSVHIDGRHGLIDLGTDYESRTLEAQMILKATSNVDYLNKRSVIMKVFDSYEAFYIIDSRLPDRRWKVKLSGLFAPEHFSGSTANVNLSFQSYYPYAESVSEIVQTFNSASFTVMNNGALINPREVPFKIEVTYAEASADFLKIDNVTTGEQVTYNPTTQLLQHHFVIDGVKYLGEGNSVVARTNRKLITLIPGANNFTLSGVKTTEPITVTFTYRELYH